MIPLDQAIAYGITLVSLILFVIEKRRNNKTSVYMSLQGMLKATYEKHRIHQANWGMLLKAQSEKKERDISFEEHKLYVQFVALDYSSQVEQILGIMKSLEIGKDSIFNKNDFTGNDKAMSEYRERQEELAQAELEK
jgi:hypothetical protein